jgi:hypothetical protein
MGAAVVCHGCGQPVEVPEDYRRNKIQCPSCGVICPVTAAPAAKKGAAAAPPRRAPTPAYEEPNWFADDQPAAPPVEEAPPEPEPEPGPTRQRGMDREAPRQPERVEEDAGPPRRKQAPPEFLVPCRRCGRMIRRQRECPDCDAAEVLLSKPADGGPVVPLMEIPDAAETEDEENSDPYTLAGGAVKLCPKCEKELAPGAVVCVACGYHLHQRKRLVKTYEPIQRSWETDYTLKQRLTVFGILLAVTVIGGASAASAGAGTDVFAGSVFLFILAGSFLLGTYSRLDVERNSRGKAKLTKAWRVCFLPLPPNTLDWRAHEEIVTGQAREVQFWEWLVLFSLLVGGIIPGIIWWYFTIHKVRFHAALAQDHGYPSVYLFEGWSEAQMKEIAHTVADATGLPLHLG